MTCSRVLPTIMILPSTQLSTTVEPTPTLHMRVMIFAWDTPTLNQSTLRMISAPIKPTSPISQVPCLATHPRFPSLSPSGMNLLTRSKKLIIANNKNVVSSSPCSPATLCPASHTPPINTKPVINHQVKVHEVDYHSETPSDEPSTEDHHQDPLLVMVHDSLSQIEILDSADIAPILSINQSTTQKDS